MWSNRLHWKAPLNAVAAAAARAPAGALIDLTEANPTRVALPYPEAALASALARAGAAHYAPAPLGLASARRAVAAEYERAGIAVDPERVVLTASSSESYAFLFKICCDPGQAVLVPEPSYPLFEYLANLEGVAALPYRLAYDGVWHIDFDSILAAVARARAAGTGARALVVVNPNNPTGSFIKRDELARLGALCANAELALISDEVFAPYPFASDETRVATVAVDRALANAVPAFSLGGLSKSCGLPQLKLGWIVIGGGRTDEARDALELVADTYLSVATPVQQALPDLLAIGADIRAAIATRIADNRAALAAAMAADSPATLLTAEAGWSAIVRLPATRSDEEWATRAATRAGVLVHPGYLFDLTGGCFLVLSLLPEPERFRAGVRRLLALVEDA